MDLYAYDRMPVLEIKLIKLVKMGLCALESVRYNSQIIFKSSKRPLCANVGFVNVQKNFLAVNSHFFYFHKISFTIHIDSWLVILYKERQKPGAIYLFFHRIFVRPPQKLEHEGHSLIKVQLAI